MEKGITSMKFMVSISLRILPQDQEKILPLVAEEQTRVQTLREQGVIEARYINSDRLLVWLVMQGESQDQVQKDLESLPLYPSMEVAITPLDQI
jgi:muconolactone delta-isomerase